MPNTFRMSTRSGFAGLVLSNQMSGGFVPIGDYESIATVSVGSGGVATVEFSSIPATLKNLQIRYLSRSTATGGDSASELVMKFNNTSDTTRSHGLVGTGAAVSAQDTSTNGYWTFYTMPNNSVTASMFGAGIIDILDYTHTSKNTTSRMLGGFDKNGGGQITIQSHLWINTAVINRITFTLGTGNFAQYSHFALYGIKG